jgi:hypothetical protein
MPISIDMGSMESLPLLVFSTNKEFVLNNKKQPVGGKHQQGQA